MHRASVRIALAAAFYALLAIALTWPLVLHPASLVPSDLGDPLLNTWIMSWNARAVPLTEQWWNAPIFVPITGALGFSEHLLGLAPVTTPIILATGDPLLAYNVVFLLAFPLTALATHYLGYTLTRRHDLACVAAIAFAFAPYRMAQMAHLQVIATWWMPLTLAGLHQYFDDEQRGRKWLALFAGAWLMQALTCGYYLFYLSVLIALWLAWFALFRRQGRDIVRVVAASSVAGVLLAPVLYGYWRITRAYDLHRGIDEIRAFSADLASVLTASDMSRAWHWLRVFVRPEADLFPGLTVILLALGGVIMAWARAEGGGRYLRSSRLLAAVSVVPLLVGLARFLYGPFRIGIGPLRLLSVRTADKPITTALLGLMAAAVLHPVVRAAWRQRSSLAFYVLAAAAMWALSLGPAPTLLDAPALSAGPYGWLLWLPGMDGVRVPARFWMLAALCLAVAATLGLRGMMQQWPRAAGVMPAVAVAALLIDGWPYAIPMAPRPAERPNHATADLRLDLPLNVGDDIVSVYRAASHRRPLFNGYSGYFAPHYWALERLLAERDPDILRRLAEFGSVEVTVDHERDPDRTWRRFVEATAAGQMHEDGVYSSYLLPHSPAAPVALSGQLLIPVSATASVNTNLSRDAMDGNIATRWHAGREQRKGDTFSVDLGALHAVTGVELLLGRFEGDFPVELEVETSLDGVSWVHGWRGRTLMMVFDALLRDPRGVPLAVRMTPRDARFIRLTQAGFEMVRDWSITELRILTR